MPRALRLTALTLSASVVLACGGQSYDSAADKSKTEPQPQPVVQPPAPDPLIVKVSQFAPAELTVDITALSEAEQLTLNKLIAAARKMDPIFDRQAWIGNPALRDKLAKGASPFKLEYFDIMRGPWDRQDHFAPFAIETPHPPGAGFYPENLSVDDFKRWLADHPADKAAFESLTTVIERTSTGLTAVPYSKAYAEWLEPAAELLRQAAATTENKSLKKFLESRAAAFASDDYYASDKDWMDLDSPVEITIGPYETYEDELLGLKASFEAFVTISDPKASADLARFKNYLPATCRSSRPRSSSPPTRWR